MHGQMYAAQQAASESEGGSRVHKRLADAKRMGDTGQARTMKAAGAPLALAAFLQLEAGPSANEEEVSALRDENAALHAAVVAMKRIANSFFSLEIEEDELQKQVPWGTYV